MVTKKPTIRVLLADDHHLVRKGIRSLLEKADDIEVIGEAGDGQEALDLVDQLLPDVLVLDVAMPRLDGMQAVERLCASDLATRTVILSMYADKTLVRQALRSGACGYLLKRSVTEELLLAIRAANRGDLYLSPAISRSILSELLAPPEGDSSNSPFDQLTPREREILQLIAEGHTNAAISRVLELSTKTVEKHRANLMIKLGVHDLPGLMRVAIKRGLVFLEE